MATTHMETGWKVGKRRGGAKDPTKLGGCIPLRQLCATLRNATCQAPLSMGFSRQEHSSGLPCPPPGDLSDGGIESVSLMSPALAAGSLPLVPPGKPFYFQLQT